MLEALTCAPITRSIRGVSSEVLVGADEGLRQECVIVCDNIVTISKRVLDVSRVGFLSPVKTAQLDRAIRDALGIHY